MFDSYFEMAALKLVKREKKIDTRDIHINIFYIVEMEKKNNV